MAKKGSILLEADPGDPEDFPGQPCGAGPCPHAGRRIRRLRNRLGLTQEGFCRAIRHPAKRDLPVPEIARTMPPPAVRAYLTVIESEPEMAARALHPDTA